MLIKQSSQRWLRNGTPARCDECLTVGPSEKGYAYTARGASGRWCEVLWLCDRCGDHAAWQRERSFGGALTPQEARDYVAEHWGERGDWCDF